MGQLIDMHLKAINLNNKIDYSDWVKEKIEETIIHLSYLSQIEMDKGSRQDLFNAISNQILLYAAVTGKTKMYDSRIIEFIFQRGINAFNSVKYLFDLSDYKGIYIEKFLERNTITKVLDLITDEKNRTMIYSLISPLKHKNKWLEEVESDLNKVTMNKQSWSDFYNKHKNDKGKNINILEDDITEVIEYIYNLR